MSSAFASLYEEVYGSCNRSFSGFLYNRGRKPKNFGEKHNKETGTAVKTDTETNDALLHIDDSKLNWPSPCSYCF